MEILCRTPNFYDELQLRHDGMKVTASTSAIKSGDKVIGAYVDKQGIPRNIYRGSDYGQQILLAYQDNRRFNPEAWTIIARETTVKVDTVERLKKHKEAYESEISRYINLRVDKQRDVDYYTNEIITLQTILQETKDSINNLEKVPNEQSK